MSEKDAKLDDVAAKAGVPVVETAEFEATAPPKEIGASDEVAEAAFKLTTADPNSDAITTEGGYYVLQLSGITPATPMTLDDAKKQLTEELTAERANEALNLKAADFRKKISEAVTAGKSFADAAKEAGATPEPFPTFSQAEPKMDQPDAQEIMGRATEMNEGDLSEFVPTAAGGLLLHIDKHLPVDEAGFEKEKPMIVNNLDRIKKEAAFQQWLKGRRSAAGFSEVKS